MSIGLPLVGEPHKGHDPSFITTGLFNATTINDKLALLYKNYTAAY